MSSKRVSSVSRRQFSANAVLSAGAALVVSAFDPVARRWVSSAEARPKHRCLPPLDGELVFDAASLVSASDDFGHLIHHAPWAVLRPGSVDDLVAMLKFAKQERLRVAMQGQSHSTYGQAQAAAGIVVDSRSLDQIHAVTPQYVEVDAGVIWRDLVNVTMQHELAPLALTDYLGLSVGGVLSVGGIGGATHRHGFVADNCLELQVVTGGGQVVTCSPSVRSDLFESVLGGLGQHGLIVRAKIPLAPQLPNGRVFQVVYENISDYLADLRQLASEERFDFLEGQVIASPTGGWAFMLEAALWYDETPPDANDALAGLRANPSSATVTDYTYLQWVNRVDFAVEQLKAAGLWETPHPWLDLFLPDSEIEAYVTSVLATLTPADVGAGLQLLYPFKRQRLGPSLVQVPEQEVSWLYDILRIPFEPSVAPQQVAHNRQLYEAAAAVGGKRYPICAVPFTQADWMEHYGQAWRRVRANKRRFDPHLILTPGQNMF